VTEPEGDHDAICAGFQMKVNILDRANAAADGEGRKAISRDIGQDVEQPASTSAQSRPTSEPGRAHLKS